MATTCPSFLRGNAMRVTRLNNCGQPIYGPCNQVISDGFVTVSLSAEVEEGEEVNVTKANGKICISDKACDQLKWYTVETEFCQVDPTLIQMMNPTWDLICDNQGDIVGWDAKGNLDCDTGFALEIWLDTYGATDVCTGQEAAGAWGYMLLPWVVGGAPGDLEIGNDAISFTFSGRTKMGARWGKGPYPVQLGNNNVPGPLLTPITKDTQYRLFVTTVAPPEPECGCQPVDRPTPEPAELTITGLPTENPRQSVRMRVDNHGFGNVTIDWGDGTPIMDSADGRFVTHKYAADGNYTIKVCDKQTPAVCKEQQLTIPLPSDAPTIMLSCIDGQPNQVKATVTMPPQSNGKGWINWGDGTKEQEFWANGDPGDVPVCGPLGSDVIMGEGGVVEITHDYANNGLYTVSVRRQDSDQYRTRVAIPVPCKVGPQVTAEMDPADTTGMTTLLTWSADSPVTIEWGDGQTATGASAGTLSHPYTNPGTYTITVYETDDPTSRTEVEITVPWTAPAECPEVTPTEDTTDTTRMTVTLAIDNLCDGDTGPTVTITEDTTDTTRMTATAAIDNTTTA